jgi:hypothetical protein
VLFLGYCTNDALVSITQYAIQHSSLHATRFKTHPKQVIQANKLNQFGNLISAISALLVLLTALSHNLITMMTKTSAYQYRRKPSHWTNPVFELGSLSTGKPESSSQNMRNMATIADFCEN